MTPETPKVGVRGGSISERPPEIATMDWRRGELRTAVLCDCALNETGWCNCGAFTSAHTGGAAPDGYVWKDLQANSPAQGSTGSRTGVSDGRASGAGLPDAGNVGSAHAIAGPAAGTEDPRPAGTPGEPLKWPLRCKACRCIGGCACGRQDMQPVPLTEIAALVHTMELDPTAHGLTERQHRAAAILTAMFDL